MKRIICIIATMLIVCPTIWAYDFSIISSDGIPRYYTITSSTTVEAASPHINGGWGSSNQKPSGALIIPSHVIYQNDTFLVTGIGFWAFGECPNITSVTIPSTVKYIDRWAFWGCSNLVTIVFPSTPVYVEHFAFHGTGWYSNQPFDQLIYLGNTLYKYKGCTRKSEDYSINIPSNTNSIAGGAFSSDSYWGPDTGSFSPLVSVSIPSSVKYIGGGAFNGCKLAYINLPDSLEYIGSGALSNTKINSITIPPKVKSISGAFTNNDSLTTIIILAEHLQVDSAMHAFAITPFLNCPNLKKVIIGNNVTCIIDNLFNGCSGLDTIIIPNSVRTIGYMSLRGCTGLKSLTIGEGVDSISPFAFANLDSLEELNYNAVNCTTFPPLGCNTNFHLNIGGNVRKIPNNFLSNCTNFSDSITLPYGLRYIGTFAFCSTGATGKIDIPATVDSIGSATFMSCQNITGIVCRRQTPPVIEGIMGSYNLPLEVPCGSIAEYQSAPIWHNYSSITGFGCDNTIVGEANDPNAGSVLGSGTYSYGETVTLTAIPNNGYQFDHWQDGNTDNPRTITVTSDATYIAYFVSTQGIVENSMEKYRIYLMGNQIMVDGTTDEVRVFDIVGRSVRNEALPNGVYMVKIGARPARKVVVMK